MSRWRMSFFLVIGALLVLIAAGIWLARSDWLRERIRTGIIEQAEKATGGKVELGAFRFDWRTLTAEVDRFVIHGTEPAREAPLLTIDRVVVGLRIISLIRRDINVASVEADHPQAHITIDSSGRTNLPEPKIRNLKKPIIETILDVKIARFDLKNGSFALESPGQPSRVVPWDAHGESLAAVVKFDSGARRYAGDITLAPLHLGWNGSARLDAQIAAHASMEQNRIVIASGRVKTAESEINLSDTVVNSFTAPVTTGRFEARVSLAEVTKIFRLKGRQSGLVNVAGDARFVSLADYRVTGSVRGAGIEIDHLRNIRVAATIEAVPHRIELSGMRIGVLGGEIAGRAEIRDFDSFKAAGQVAHFDVREIAAMDTKQALPWDALISGPFEASGRLDGRIPDLNLHAAISPVQAGAAVHGDVALRYNASPGKIELGQSWIELPHTRIDVSGTLGERLDVKLTSRDAKDVLPVLALIPDIKTEGLAYSSIAFSGTVAGALRDPLVSGHASGKSLQYDGEIFDSLAGDFSTSNSSLTVNNGTMAYRGLDASGSGSVGLKDWRGDLKSPIKASVQVANADLTKLLALAGHKEVQVSGTVNTTAQITGTLAQPLANADVNLTKGFIYGQPFDSISGKAQYIDASDQVLTGLFVSGPKRVNITARFEHAGTQFPAGKLEFNLTSNTMPLNQIALVRRQQPDIRGFGKFHADGALRISHDAKHEIQFDLLNLNADASANGLELAGRNLGDARFTAQTKGDVMTAHFESNAAKASIHGDGTMQLTGDYSVDGKLTFSNAGLNAMAALIVTADQAKDLNFDGTAEGDVTIGGPAKKPEQMTATLNVRQLELHPLAATALAQSMPDMTVRNNGPIRVSLAKSMLRVESARFQAPETDVSFDGAIALSSENPLNLRARGNVNLALAHAFSPDLTSSGLLTIAGAIRGSWRAPDISGQATIRNGDFHYTDFSNGLTNANGDILFNGNRASLQAFSAESGGGKVDATGFAALTNGLVTFRIEAHAHEVRMRYPEGVSSVSDANLTFAGTSRRSEASGTVTVHRIAINPKSDAATILALSAEPVKTPSAKTGLLANMNLDVQVETAPDVALQTSVTQTIQADANLRLRGTATNPAVLGRINITQGDLIFFGSKYSITQGSISFFNPGKIDPILNIDLETKARGVDVILTVSGPINKLNLSYRSDPPLQFSDILALLATGRAPTNAALGVHDTGQSQSFQQLGASALIGQAIANPVAGRLQRFFGVSRLKIDPQLTGITGSPEARLTVEQQITPDLLFTYITDVSSTSTQLIRVEWAFNRHWSAILIREENGYVGLDFAYKKRFR